MPVTSILFALAFYVAAAVLVFGLLYRIVDYARTPAPLKIPTTPAPTTRSGVVVRMAEEVLLFRSLFRSNKWIWLFGFAFHVALAVVLARHLRYFTEPVWYPVQLIQPFGIYAGLAMVGALAMLWLRRFAVSRVRYISAPSDHLWLLLLILIGASGLAMKYVAHTDIVATCPGINETIDAAQLAWLDAQFDNYTVAQPEGLGDIAGHSTSDGLRLDGWQPAFSPEWSFALTASYLFDAGRWGRFRPMLQTSYSSDYYTNDFNLPGALQQAHQVTDIRLFWDLPGDKVRLQLFIENFSDEQLLHATTIYNPVERPDIATFLAAWGDPRKYGLTLSYHY
jgi:nitrate reductase gamma subunit